MTLDYFAENLKEAAWIDIQDQYPDEYESWEVVPKHLQIERLGACLMFLIEEVL